MKKIYHIIIVILLMIIGCKSEQSVNPSITQNGKPDLIIETITYTRLSNCYQDYPSGIICGGPRFEFTLKIKNIGSAAVSSPLFICNSRSKWDFENQYCSYGQRLNDPSLEIPINGSLDIKLVSNIDDSVHNVFFILNTNDKYDSGLNVPKIDEVDYTNNSYIESLSW